MSPLWRGDDILDKEVYRKRLAQVRTCAALRVGSEVIPVAQSSKEHKTIRKPKGDGCLPKQVKRHSEIISLPNFSPGIEIISVIGTSMGRHDTLTVLQ